MNGALAEAGPSIWFFAKVIVIIFIVLYNMFAIVVVRQVGLMTRTLALGFESVIKVFAYLHLVFAIGVLLIAVFVL